MRLIHADRLHQRSFGRRRHAARNLRNDHSRGTRQTSDKPVESRFTTSSALRNSGSIVGSRHVNREAVIVSAEVDLHRSAAHFAVLDIVLIGASTLVDTSVIGSPQYDTSDPIHVSRPRSKV